MKSKWRVMLSVVAAVFLLSLLAVPVLAATTATRAIGDTSLEVGQSTTVTVTITTTDEFAVVLTEDVPAGLTMSNVVTDGAYNAAESQVVWLDIGQNPLGTVTVSYTLTATAIGSYIIAGTVIDIGENVVATVNSSVVVSGGVAGTTATRGIVDTTLTVGQNTTVTVSITTDEFAVVLTEDVPAGLTMSNVVTDGTYNAAESQVVWLDVGQNPLGTVTVSYTLTATAVGSYIISGTVIDIDENVVATVDSSVTVYEEAPPAAEYPSFTGWLDWWI